MPAQQLDSSHRNFGPQFRFPHLKLPSHCTSLIQCPSPSLQGNFLVQHPSISSRVPPVHFSKIELLYYNVIKKEAEINNYFLIKCLCIFGPISYFLDSLVRRFYLDSHNACHNAYPLLYIGRYCK